jgi:hypothetical protein
VIFASFVVKNSSRKNLCQSVLKSVSITPVREDFVSRRERRERREKTGKKVGHAVLLRDLCASARTFSFRQGFGLGLRAVPGRGMLLWEEDFLNRRKQREQSVTGLGPSLRFLCCLLFASLRSLPCPLCGRAMNFFMARLD